jgi:hypothetical protein
MIRILFLIGVALRALVRSRSELVLENLALRQQVAVLAATARRPRISDGGALASYRLSLVLDLALTERSAGPSADSRGSAHSDPPDGGRERRVGRTDDSRRAPCARFQRVGADRLALPAEGPNEAGCSQSVAYVLAQSSVGGERSARIARPCSDRERAASATAASCVRRVLQRRSHAFGAQQGDTLRSNVINRAFSARSPRSTSAPPARCCSTRWCASAAFERARASNLRRRTWGS